MFNLVKSTCVVRVNDEWIEGLYEEYGQRD